MSHTITVALVNINDEYEDEEQSVDVVFDVVGKYYPQTLTSPTEYPELEVLSVTLNGVCIVDDLQEVHNKGIEELCWQHLTELKKESYEDRETR